MLADREIESRIGESNIVYFPIILSMLKGRISRILRKEFPELKKWCKQSLWAPSCYHGSVGHGWEVVENYIAGQDRKPKG